MAASQVFAAGEVCVLRWACDCSTSLMTTNHSVHCQPARYLFSRSRMPLRKESMLCSYAGVLTLSLFCFGFFFYVFLVTAISCTQHSSPNNPHPLPHPYTHYLTHYVSAIKLKPTRVPCQDKLNDRANREILPSLHINPQQCISSYECKRIHLDFLCFCFAWAHACEFCVRRPQRQKIWQADPVP